MEEIKEKLNEQANEMRLLKEIVMKGCKGIENLSLQYLEKLSNKSAHTAAEDNEVSKCEMIPNDVSNDTENQNSPDLPLPIPNLF